MEERQAHVPPGTEGIKKHLSHLLSRSQAGWSTLYVAVCGERTEYANRKESTTTREGAWGPKSKVITQNPVVEGGNRIGARGELQNHILGLGFLELGQFLAIIPSPILPRPAFLGETAFSFGANITNPPSPRCYQHHNARHVSVAMGPAVQAAPEILPGPHAESAPPLAQPAQLNHLDIKVFPKPLAIWSNLTIIS